MELLFLSLNTPVLAFFIKCNHTVYTVSNKNRSGCVYYILQQIVTNSI